MRNHRFLQDHVVNPANDRLTITVLDEPGSGGAHHLYMISGFDTGNNPSKLIADDIQGNSIDMAVASMDAVPIIFQNGPINEFGVNGITHEALLAILADRLRSFQAGPFACNNNARALACIEEAQYQLQRRTRDRMARGIEGTHVVGAETVPADLESATLLSQPPIVSAITENLDRSTDGIAEAIEGATTKLD